MKFKLLQINKYFYHLELYDKKSFIGVIWFALYDEKDARRNLYIEEKYFNTLNYPIIYFIRLNIEKQFRNLGYGRIIVTEFFKVLNKKFKNIQVILHAEPYDDNPLTKERLKKWYSGFGFKKFSKNYMIRE